MSREAMVGLGLIAFFAACALAELLFPRDSQERRDPGDRRLVTNFGLAIMVLVVGGLFPLARLSSSLAGDQLHLGLAHIVAIPWIALLIATILVDSFAAYWVHRLMHATPILWRVHRVHHSDSAVDVSTSFRNHPLELLVTLPTAALVVILIGAPPSVIVAAQTLFMAAKIWEHADIRLPARLDRAASWVIVTPALHRVHHSPLRERHDSNFGDTLIVWDRWFGTLRRGQATDRVGLEGQRAPNDHLLQQIWSPLYPA